MKLADFLDRYVDGYLFKDLDSMSEITTVGGQAGAVGYPMVATALSGIELLGALTSSTPFSVKAGKKYFTDFWKKCYPTDYRNELAPLVYQLVRHGLAHMAFAKPLICVYKDPGATSVHLHLDNDGALLIHAVVLAKDLKRAYVNTVKQNARGSDRRTMQHRLNEMLDSYRRDANSHRSILTRVPAANPISPSTMAMYGGSIASVSGGTFMNLPTPAANQTKPRKGKSHKP